MKVIRQLLILMLLTMSYRSYAQEFALNIVELRGTGCPQGSHSSVASPDGSSLSILFDGFSAVVPNESTDNDNDDVDDVETPKKLKNKSSRWMSRKACNIVLNALIPADQKIVGLDIITDVRGMAMMDLGTEGSFQSLFVGKKGLGHKGSKESVLVGSKTWKAKKNDVFKDWLFSKNYFLPLGTGCAKKQDRKILLSLKTVLMAKILDAYIKDSPRGEVLVDSSDIMGSLRVKVRTQTCKSNK